MLSGVELPGVFVGCNKCWNAGRILFVLIIHPWLSNVCVCVCVCACVSVTHTCVSSDYTQSFHSLSCVKHQRTITVCMWLSFKSYWCVYTMPSVCACLNTCLRSPNNYFLNTVPVSQWLQWLLLKKHYSVPVSQWLTNTVYLCPSD